ncbi:19603_t:CDS:2 [Funneliformis geosporum]|nr:19603_t:CDS:2 [Funneliformis geosporum]
MIKEATALQNSFKNKNAQEDFNHNKDISTINVPLNSPIPYIQIPEDNNITISKKVLMTKNISFEALFTSKVAFASTSKAASVSTSKATSVSTSKAASVFTSKAASTLTSKSASTSTQRALQSIDLEETNNKRKRINDLSFKLDANAQSILDKILEEQLKQNIMIDTLQYEIFENRKLLKNIKNVLTIFASGSLTMMNEKQPKQWLKRKDTKHM